MTISPDTTIDPAEVARFRQLASDWWDPKGRMRPLHEIAPTRLGFIRAEACRHFARDAKSMRALSGLRVLDIGCAVGLVSEPMARMGGTVTGIDPGAELISAARTHAAGSGLTIDYRNARTEELAAAHETFDLVLCLEVVEHVPEAGAFLATCTQLVAPGGLLIVSTINRTLKSFALAIVGAEYVLRWLPRGTHDWQRFVTPSELSSHLAAQGFKIATQRGMIFNPLVTGWTLSGDTEVNYFAAAVRDKVQSSATKSSDSG
jgi:2-polyprenyl-6-hydroxyphenyl methylase / 3-demethylubiquinone-9 3-methyltransferase